jgi:formate hydrogenlyase transcriptional activator
MERAVKSTSEVLSLGAPAKGESGLFSIESVLNLQKLIFAGSPLSEVLTNIAQLVESQAEGMFCTIWLPMRTERSSIVRRRPVFLDSEIK